MPKSGLGKYKFIIFDWWIWNKATNLDNEGLKYEEENVGKSGKEEGRNNGIFLFNKYILFI